MTSGSRVSTNGSVWAILAVLLLRIGEIFTEALSKTFRPRYLAVRAIRFPMWGDAFYTKVNSCLKSSSLRAVYSEVQEVIFGHYRSHRHQDNTRHHLRFDFLQSANPCGLPLQS